MKTRIRARNGFESVIASTSSLTIGYSTNKSGDWEHKIIDAETYYFGGIGFSWVKGEDPVLVIDNENIYIAYYHHLLGHIRVTEVGPCSGYNTYVVPDSNISTYTSSNVYKSISASMTLTSNKIHISYRDNPNGNIKHLELDKSTSLNSCSNDSQVWFQKYNENTTRSVRIINNSTNDRVIQGIYLYDIEQFSFESNNCTGKAPSYNQSCNIEIGFDAQSIGANAFSLSVDYTESGSDKIHTIGVNEQVNVFR